MTRPLPFTQATVKRAIAAEPSAPGSLGAATREHIRRVAEGTATETFYIDLSKWTDADEVEFDRPIPIRSPNLRIGHVYVIGFASYVKIGWSGHVAGRMKEIQSLVPDELVLFASIGGLSRFDEARLHERFATYRTRGEWFRREGELAAWIEAGCPL